MKDTKKPTTTTAAAAAASSGPAAPATAPPPTPAPTPVDPNAMGSHRLHLGGFRDALTSTDISSRFSSFGQVSDVVIPTTDTGLPRGFAHFSLTSTNAQYTRLLSVYNGTKWKGGVISLHPAKPRPQDLRQAERDRIAEKQRARALNFGTAEKRDAMPLDGGWPAWQRTQMQLRRRARRGAMEGKHVGYIDKVMADDAKHLDLAGKHRMWKRVKFGRVLPVMRRLRTPLGPITMDPSRMRDGFERLYSSAKGGKRVAALTWEIVQEEGEGEDEAQEAGKSMDYWEDVEREMRRVNGEQFGPAAVEEQDDEGQYDEDQDASMMDVDEEEGEHDSGSESSQVHEPQQAKPASAAAKSMFSDDEDADADGSDDDIEMADGHADDERFEYKEQFVGEHGKRLLALQKKSKGDDRFKFTSDFAPDAPSDADDDHSDAEPDFFDSLPRSSASTDPNASTDHPDLDDNDENTAKNVRKERSMAMSLLAGMFGAEATRDAVDHARLQSKGLKPTGGDRTFELTGMVFYDPMGAEAAKYEVAPPEVVEEEEPVTQDADEVQEAKKQKKKKPKAKKKYSFESSSEDEDASDKDETDAMDVDAPKTMDNGVSSLFATPIVETDSAKVHADFSSIFTRGGPTVEASGFSLFGAGAADSSDSDDSDSDSDSESKSARPFFAILPSAASTAAKSAAASAKATGARPITLASPFLFLTVERLAAAESKSFVRTRTDAEAKVEWQATRWELMGEVRKRHKNAARKARQRAAGKMAAGGVRK